MAIYKMSDGALMTINMENYSEDEFIVGAVDFLGTNANTHKIDISEEVFKQCASTVLGKFLVAKVAYGDASGHAADEVIVGYFPREQEVRYIRNRQGFLRGVADAVISKQYASDFCNIFTQANNTRSVSVEMGVEEEPNDNGTTAKRFNIMGVTVLGMSVRPSSPGSTINIKRFEDTSVQSDCEKYYKSVWQKLAEREQIIQFENKSYSINTTELKETPWGDVDKTELRNKIMEASNKSELVKACYMLVEDGWEDAPSEHLKYPVMCFEGEEGLMPVSAVSYGKKQDAKEQAHNIFAVLRELDKKRADKIFVRCPDMSGVGLAVYNRLIRSAGFKIIEC